MENLTNRQNQDQAEQAQASGQVVPGNAGIHEVPDFAGNYSSPEILEYTQREIEAARQRQVASRATQEAEDQTAREARHEAIRLAEPEPVPVRELPPELRKN